MQRQQPLPRLPPAGEAIKQPGERVRDKTCDEERGSNVSDSFLFNIVDSDLRFYRLFVRP